MQVPGDAAAVSPLAQLAEPAVASAFRAGTWPGAPRLSRASSDQLPAWLRHPALTDAGALQALCPLAKFSITHSDVPYQVPLDGLSGPLARLLVRFGLTVSVSEAAASLPGARAWLDELAAELGLPAWQVDAMLFISAPGRGLPFHFDAYDAFIVQLQGCKTWQLGRNPAVESPIDMQYVPGTPPSPRQAAIFGSNLRAPSGDEVETVTLEPGSVLFVPRGTWHQTAASATSSVSVSILLNAPSIGDVLLQQLRDVIAQEPRLRAPARGFVGSPEQRARAVRAFERGRAALRENVAQLTAQAALESFAPAQQLTALITPSTRFARNPSRQLALPGTESSSEPLLELPFVDTAAAKPYDGLATGLVLPPVALPPLRWLLAQHEAFAASALAEAFPGLHFESLAGLLAELVAARALILLPFGPCSRTREYE